MHRFTLAVGCLLAVGGSALPRNAAAQIGTSADIITGTVTRDDDSPVSGAIVEAFSLETQITRSTHTDQRGRYTIVFTDGGGQYRMTAKSIGLTPAVEIIARIGDEDRLVWNTKLGGSTVQIAAITTEASRQPVTLPERPSPGSTERAFTADQLARLPIDVADINALAALIPGVVMIDATDSTATAFSVAGQRSDANALTLDGLNFGTSAIPQDGLRSTRVITSTYDVSRGQFTGGQVSAQTRSGSNVVTGTSNYQLRDPEFAVEDTTSAYAAGPTVNTLSAGLGGPIVKNRVLAFVSGQGRLQSTPQQSLLSALPTDLTRLGISADSAARFVAILGDATHGERPFSVVPVDAIDNNNVTGLLRMDYLLAETHTLTMYGNLNGTMQEPARVGPLALPQTGGIITNSGGGGMVALTSRFGISWINDLRANYTKTIRDGDALDTLPAGRVTVLSTLPDGRQGFSTLVFGGNAGQPTRSTTQSINLSDELSLLSGAGGHRFRLGGLFTSDRATSTLASNQLGTFTYNSLDDLEANRPATFRRTLQPASRNSLRDEWSAFAGDIWVPLRQLQLTYGVRYDAGRGGDAPAYNPTLDSVFSRRTDDVPSDWMLSPRIGFTWTPDLPNFGVRNQAGAAGGARGGAGGGGGGRGGRGGGGFGGAGFSPAGWTIRGGIGLFRSTLPSNLLAQVATQTGVAGGESQITCTGAAVPTPNWAAYLESVDSIPSACVGPTGPSQGASRTASVFAPDFAASRALRASLSVTHQLNSLFRVSLDGNYARGFSLSGSRDLNLNPTAQFTLADEGDRPVYVPANTIVPQTGALRFNNSRVDPRFGEVLEYFSGLESESEQLTSSVGGILGRGIQLSLSYTWSHQRDQASGTGFGSNTTAANPNEFEWGRSDLERQHAFNLQVTYPAALTLDLSAIGRLSSGTPFTPLVSGDVNGDGARDDRAFIFPAGTPVGDSIQSLIASAPGRLRDCLVAQLGTVAARNSCAGPWQASFELQLNWRPEMFGLNRRLQLSVTTQNLLRGVDELIHGKDGALGWGLTTRPDPNLLTISRFDTLARQYVYAVNGRFGNTSG
ncbi:MAG TPA: TonB-dependent receptor, partial [Gemmatimonadales bacterium]